ncbi:MAG: pyridoxamine 5'-phosphate oxidase family protein [Proteobacteria bacterium]|nr:pyridoxamine 5'-phosphate oxidase family protein [Pseudomonadota bacterium]
MQTDTTAKLWDLIRDIKYGMFTARHGNGHLHSRPMTTLDRDEQGGILWFFMSRSSEPVMDIENMSEVNLSYSDAGRDAYVSVSGTAHVVNDMGQKKRLWSPMVQAWFPGGIDDPDLALVAVTIDHAEYWDVKTNKATKIYEMAKAAMTGTTPSIGEHAQVRMR